LKVNVVLLEPPTPVVKSIDGDELNGEPSPGSCSNLAVIPGGKKGVLTVTVPGSFPFVAFTVIATDSEFSPH